MFSSSLISFPNWCRHQGSELVAEKLVKEFTAVIGFPFKLHTYQGSNFQSILFKEVCFVCVVCVEVLRPSQPNGVMLSPVSLSNHTFTGQA